MTAIYTAKVDSVDRTERRLVLTLTNRGQEPCWPDSTAAGLFLLLESAHYLDRDGKSPMKGEGHGVERWVDHPWLFDHAETYVEAFDPIDGSGDDPDASMIFALRVTDARWLAHLRKGALWDSTCPCI